MDRYLLMNAQLNDEQRKALTSLIFGCEVHDLGAGDLRLAHELFFLGARAVIAIDRHRMPKPETPAVTCVEGFFENYHEPVDVAFMGYPVNWRCDLAPIASRARIVIYLGKNTDGTSCGSKELFAHLQGREVLAYIPDRRNTLIIYGPTRVERARLPEEVAKATEDEKMWSYDELMENAMKQLKEFGCYVFVGDDGRLKVIPMMADGSCFPEDANEPESSADNHEAFFVAANKALGTNFEPTDYPGL